MSVPAPRIAPVSPGPSLLTSASRLPGNLDWERGIRWASGCAESFGLEFCPADPTRDVPGDGFIAHAQPFMVYTPVVCDLQTVDLSDQAPFASAITEAHTAYHVARALWMGEGVADVTDPQSETLPVTLRRVATPLLQGSAIDLDDAVGALLAEYEQATTGQGGAVIHMPSVLAPFALGGGTGGARVCWPEGNLYRGPLDSVVVPGPGYPLGSSTTGADGFGPLTSAGPPEQYAGNSATEVWVYVSGPVEYAVTPVVVLPEGEQDRKPFRTNRYELWGQRQAIVRVDPCSVFAVKVTNPVPPTEVS